MRSIFLVLAVMAAACTKKNPDACCIDEADCASIGLPVGSTCDDGLSCRNNRCVELECSVSAQCDVLAPYCIGGENGLCQASCSDDTECPGFGQSSAERYCEGGSCVQCRAAMSDCDGATPVCDGGGCRRCNAHEECESGVCTDEGSCAFEVDIAYVSPAGSAVSGCTRAEPCTLPRALQMGLDRTYVLVASGSYQNPGSLTVNGRTFIIGTGARPIITRTGTGPIFAMAFGAEATFENVEINGARNTTNDSDGVGILCNQTASIRVLRSVLTRNAYAGLAGSNCTFTISESELSENLNGVNVTDTKGTIERSNITRNTGSGVALDAGLYTITNNFIFRNATGANYFPSNTGTVFQFNTVVDNTRGIACQVIGGGSASFPYNLVVRNGTNAELYDCSFGGSFVSDDIAPLKFKSPDVAPFDYHLTAGSAAIDQISESTQTKDFDGESRPAGNGHDYGADEVH